MNTPSMQDLLTAGVHFGHKVSRSHPKMREFIFGDRDGVDIIDLEKSEEKLKAAIQASYELGKSGKVMMIVGTKKQAKEIVEELAKEVETPYLSVRWVGGLLTNFEEIKKNFKRLNELKKEQEKGELTRYTKKEQLLIARKLEKFTTELGGVANLEKIPEAMFVVDAVADNTGIKEAQAVGLQIVGLCDTNANPNWFDYPVPANDDGIKSIKLLCETMIRSYGEGKKEFIANGIKLEAELEEEKVKETKRKEDEVVAAEAAAKLAASQVELAPEVAAEAAALEEVIEKKTLADSERKV